MFLTATPLLNRTTITLDKKYNDSTLTPCEEPNRKNLAVPRYNCTSRKSSYKSQQPVRTLQNVRLRFRSPFASLTTCRNSACVRASRFDSFRLVSKF